MAKDFLKVEVHAKTVQSCGVRYRRFCFETEDVGVCIDVPSVDEIECVRSWISGAEFIAAAQGKDMKLVNEATGEELGDLFIGEPAANLARQAGWPVTPKIDGKETLQMIWSTSTPGVAQDG